MRFNYGMISHQTLRRIKPTSRKRAMKTCATGILVLTFLAAVAHAQNKRDLAVRKDKQDLSNDTSWIYDDLGSAFAEAARSKRPMMVVFR